MGTRKHDPVASAMESVKQAREKNIQRNWVTDLPPDKRAAVEEIVKAYAAGKFGSKACTAVAKHIAKEYKIKVGESTVRRHLRLAAEAE